MDFDDLEGWESPKHDTVGTTIPRDAEEFSDHPNTYSVMCSKDGNIGDASSYYFM